MRALVCRDYGSPDDLVVEDRDNPVASRGEILVEIKAAGLNFPDVLVIGGQYQVKTPLPFTPGHEAAGVIAGIGDKLEFAQSAGADDVVNYSDASLREAIMH